MSGPRYRDRREAGQVLAAELGRRKTNPATLVLGLPRGGVPVAAEVARALEAPLDIVVVRKLGFPGHPEVAMGALAGAGGTLKLVQNPHVIAELDRIGSNTVRTSTGKSSPGNRPNWTVVSANTGEGKCPSQFPGGT